MDRKLRGESAGTGLFVRFGTLTVSYIDDRQSFINTVLGQFIHITY